MTAPSTFPTKPISSQDLDHMPKEERILALKREVVTLCAHNFSLKDIAWRFNLDSQTAWTALCELIAESSSPAPIASPDSSRPDPERLFDAFLQNYDAFSASAQNLLAFHTDEYATAEQEVASWEET